jgi:hypothetical protein
LGRFWGSKICKKNLDYKFLLVKPHTFLLLTFFRTTVPANATH